MNSFRYSLCTLALVPCLAWAQTQLEFPADAAGIVATKVAVSDVSTKRSNLFRSSAPDLKLQLGRPLKKVCFFSRTPTKNGPIVLSAADEKAEFPSGQRGESCVAQPSNPLYVWLAFESSPGSEPVTVDLGFYDPSMPDDYFFSFKPVTGTTLQEVFPAIKKAGYGFDEYVKSDFPTSVAFRSHLFQEAPASVFRTLARDLQLKELHPSTASGLTAAPVKGETVVAVSQGGTSTAFVTLDGVVFTLPSAELGAFQAEAAQLPATSRRKPADSSGTFTVHAARALAKLGVAPAEKWTKEFEKHEACYRKEWDKVDPGGTAHNYVLISAGGKVTDLDAKVDAKVRAACKSDASEKARTALLKPISSAAGQAFGSISKSAQARLVAMKN